METIIQVLLRKAESDSDVLAVLLFGSQARGDARSGSDFDVCLVLDLRRRDPLELSQKRLDYVKTGDLDVRVFQQLPLYVRRRVIKEGKVLLVKDEDALYELAFRTAQAFEDFRHRYDEYLEEVARAGS